MLKLKISVSILTLILSQLLLASAFAKSQGLEKVFFYSIPLEADPEWSYLIPECKELSKYERSQIIQCTNFDKKTGHQTCTTKKKTELTHSTTGEKKNFAMLYHVFAKKNQCVADRGAALEVE